MHQITKEYNFSSNGLNYQKVYEMEEMNINSTFSKFRKFNLFELIW